MGELGGMNFVFDNLEGLVAALALVVSIVGSVLGRYLTQKDMLKERRSSINKEIYHSFIDLVFVFFDLVSPEFVDDMLDRVIDENQYDSKDSLKSRVDRAYIAIGKRMKLIKLQTVKIDTCSSSDIDRTNDVLDSIKTLYSSYESLLELYNENFKNAYINDNESVIDVNLLRDETNKYELLYFKNIDLIKDYLKAMKTALYSR